MKKLSSLILVLLLLTACDSDSVIEEVTISDFAETVVVSLNKEDNNEVLVPIGCAMAVGDVESIEYSYSIGVSEELVDENTLNININDILIGDSDQYSHLVKIYVMGEEDGTEVRIFNDIITITIVIELLEPLDLEEAIERGLDQELVNVLDSEHACESIMGEVISFKIEFMIIQ